MIMLDLHSWIISISSEKKEQQQYMNTRKLQIMNGNLYPHDKEYLSKWLRVCRSTMKGVRLSHVAEQINALGDWTKIIVLQCVSQHINVVNQQMNIILTKLNAPFISLNPYFFLFSICPSSRVKLTLDFIGLQESLGNHCLLRTEQRQLFHPRNQWQEQ